MVKSQTDMANKVFPRPKPAAHLMLRLIVWSLIMLHCPPLLADTAYVLVSKDIRPYRQALDGFSNMLQPADGLKLEIQFLDKIERKGVAALQQAIFDVAPNMLISIGPEAVRFFHEELPNYQAPLIYTMVLNPELLLDPKLGKSGTPGSNAVCGISLNIPIPLQLREMARVMPEARRIGLLYHPEGNASFYNQALQSVKASGLSIVPLQIVSGRDIPTVLATHWDLIDALWLIPDRALKSETLFQFIIKKALLRNTPVIGYNRFFLESGALLSFIMDYEALGRQTAELALKVLAGGPCHHPPPTFSTEINYRVAEKLPIRLGQGVTPAEKESP